MPKKKEPLIDEGLRVSLVYDAFFDGDLEIPHIDAPEQIVIPDGMVPFSLRNRSVGWTNWSPKWFWYMVPCLKSSSVV